MVSIHLTAPTKAIGTSYRGHMTSAVTRKQLTAVLGEPNNCNHSDGKVTCAWVLSVNGIVVTVYDYKGERWHFGGLDNSGTYLACELVAALVRREFKPFFIGHKQARKDAQ